MIVKFRCGVLTIGQDTSATSWRVGGLGGEGTTTISENNIIISKPATFEIQSEELTHSRVLWPFWSRGGSPRVSPHSFPPTLEFPEYVVAKGWMLSVDRPVGSIPLGFGAIRPAWVDFASGSSRRFDSTWGSPRFVPQGSISLVIRPVGFDFTGFWM